MQDISASTTPQSQSKPAVVFDVKNATIQALPVHTDYMLLVDKLNK